MKVVAVPTPELGCPAYRALRMEDIGVRVLELRCYGPLDYGRLFAKLWDDGEPFVVVEHDIVPWPGAVKGLLNCPEGWCCHRYPLHRGNVCRAFGIGKYVPRGPAPEEWAKTPWHLLDGAVVPVLNKLFGQSHVHEPPVAHARRQAA